MARFTATCGWYNARHRACLARTRGHAARLVTAAPPSARPGGVMAPVGCLLACAGRAAACAGVTPAARAIAATAAIAAGRTVMNAAWRPFFIGDRDRARGAARPPGRACCDGWRRAGVRRTRVSMAGVPIPWSGGCAVGVADRFGYRAAGGIGGAGAQRHLRTGGGGGYRRVAAAGAHDFCGVAGPAALQPPPPPGSGDWRPRGP